MSTGRDPRSSALARLDHLVWATPDLERGVDEIEALTGVRASAGGKHPSWGTHNALLALGDGIYFEILAPDPEAPPPAKPRPFGLDGPDRIQASRLVTWAIREPELAARIDSVRRAGIDLGEILSGGRVRPDGVALAWRLTSPRAMLEEGLLPFLIDWGASPHPSATAAAGLSLVDLRFEHLDPARLGPTFAAFGLDVPIHPAARPALVATVDSPRGRCVLR